MHIFLIKEKCGNINLERFIHNYFETIHMQLNKTKEIEINNVLNVNLREI